MKKLLFVYNPHSGKGEIGRSLSELICAFTEGGYDVTVHPTSAQLDGQNYIAANSEGYDLIVSSGGDGMLHELFAGLLAAGTDRPGGYIPSGTINDFASSMEISKTPTEAAKIVVGGNFRTIDAGVFNDSIFSYVAAFGMFTQVSYATDQKLKNALGAGAYFIEVLRSMDLRHFNESTVHAKIIIGDTEYEDDFIFGMAGNTLSVGGLSTIVPKGASMDDGLLDFMFIKAPKNLQELDKIRIALTTNQDHDVAGIITARGESAVVLTEKPIQWTLDGEFGGETTRAELGIKKHAIRIAAPVVNS